MELSIPSQTNIIQIKENLSSRFPNYKVKHPLLNKKAINVINDSSMVIVVLKKDKLKVMSNLNIMKPWMFIVFVLLLFFTLIGGFVFYGIMWYTKKNEFKALENEVANFLKDNHGVNNS